MKTTHVINNYVLAAVFPFTEQEAEEYLKFRAKADAFEVRIFYCETKQEAKALARVLS